MNDTTNPRDAHASMDAATREDYERQAVAMVREAEAGVREIDEHLSGRLGAHAWLLVGKSSPAYSAHADEKLYAKHHFALTREDAVVIPGEVGWAAEEAAERGFYGIATSLHEDAFGDHGGGCMRVVMIDDVAVVVSTCSDEFEALVAERAWDFDRFMLTHAAYTWASITKIAMRRGADDDLVVVCQANSELASIFRAVATCTLAHHDYEVMVTNRGALAVALADADEHAVARLALQARPKADQISVMVEWESDIHTDTLHAGRCANPKCLWCEVHTAQASN